MVPAITKHFAIHRVIGHTQLTYLITVTDVTDETEIWALRLGFEGGTKKKKEKEKEKIPHMCESIGHRPLRGRCPKGQIKHLGLVDPVTRFTSLKKSMDKTL